jgi:predicted NAD/FAD-dependent oxidoreductase
MAGLAAARRLRESGFAVTLFDKGRRVGGRLSTRLVDGFMFNHGCQFFTARDPAFLAAVGAFARPWPMVGQDRFAGVPDMAAIAAGLAVGLDVRQRAHARAIARGPDGWRVRFDDGPAGPFDALILAIPAPQAASLLGEVSHPFAARLDAVHMAPCWAVMLGFDQAGDDLLNAKYRPGNLEHMSARKGSDSPISWLVRENSRPGAPAAPVAYMVHMSAVWSTVHIEDSADQVIAAAGTFAEHAVYAAAHRWRYALADQPLDAPFLLDEELGLGLCGDWCLGGRLEAAYLSGRALGISLAA